MVLSSSEGGLYGHLLDSSRHWRSGVFNPCTAIISLKYRFLTAPTSAGTDGGEVGVRRALDLFGGEGVRLPSGLYEETGLFADSVVMRAPSGGETARVAVSPRSRGPGGGPGEI